MFAIIEGLSAWQIYGIVIWLLLQGMVISVFPEEVIILSLGVMVSQHRVNPLLSFLSIEFSLLTANSMMVFIAGRFSGRKIFQTNAIRKALHHFRKQGNWVIFVTRFTPLVRGPVYAAVGLTGMRVRDFFRIDATASLIQVPMLLAVGAYIGEKSGSIAKAYQVIGIGAVSVVAVVLLGVLIRRRLWPATDEAEHSP